MQPNTLPTPPLGISGSIASAWRILALGWRKYIASLWPLLTLAGLAQAFLFEMSLRYLNLHALPALRVAQSWGDTQLSLLLVRPSGLEVLYLLLAVAACLALTYACAARVMRLINEHRSAAALPTRLPVALTKGEWRGAGRLLAIDALWLLVTGLLTALFAWLAVRFSPWFAAPLPLLYIYIWSTANVSRLRFALFGDTLRTALGFAFRRSLGNAFIVQALTLIPAALLWLVFLLPPVTYALATTAATDSLLQGDVATMPQYLPLVFLLFNTLCAFVCMLVSSWRTWALALKTAKP